MGIVAAGRFPDLLDDNALIQKQSPHSNATYLTQMIGCLNLADLALALLLNFKQRASIGNASFGPRRMESLPDLHR